MVSLHLNKRWALVSTVTLVVVIAGGIMAWQYIKSDNGQTDETANSLPVDSLSNLDKDVEQYNDTKKLLTGSDWTAATTEFSNYGDDSNNTKSLRITAYANCAYAAEQGGQTDKRTECLSAGQKLIDDLSDIDKTEAQKAFDALVLGQGYTNTDLKPGDIRE